jgi:CYTH domain-containing protein
MPLEIERKFLLKKLPDFKSKCDEVCEITQYYCNNPKVRIRQIYSYSKKKNFFIQTKKTQLKPGVYQEDEKKISQKEFHTIQESAYKAISKTRYIKKMKSVKWEVDVFNKANLIVAEVEMPTENYKLKIPKFIQDVLLIEVTEFPEFTNRNLADKWPGK